MAVIRYRKPCQRYLSVLPAQGSSRLDMATIDEVTPMTSRRRQRSCSPRSPAAPRMLAKLAYIDGSVFDLVPSQAGKVTSLIPFPQGRVFVHRLAVAYLMSFVFRGFRFAGFRGSGGNAKLWRRESEVCDRQIGDRKDGGGLANEMMLCYRGSGHVARDSFKCRSARVLCASLVVFLVLVLYLACKIGGLFVLVCIDSPRERRPSNPILLAAPQGRKET
jgi:hypothetical protein